MLRRTWRATGVIIAATLAGGLPSAATHYPSQLVRIIVPFGPGSLSDIMARIVADGLSQRWGQQVIVENRPGVAGTASTAKAPADGYTLMITSNGHTVIGLTNKNLPFDPVKDFVGVTRVSSLPLYLVISPELPAKSFDELVALARKSPGTLNFSSPGVASTAYIAGAMFRKTADVNIVHVPYRSAPDAITAVLRNDAQMYFAPVNLTAELAQSGKVRPIAAATVSRIPQLAHVPTFKEVGLNFVYDAWFGLMAPAGVKKDILDKLNSDTVAVLKSPEIQAKMASQAAVVVFDAPGEFDNIIRDDTAAMVEIFKTAM
jgi:tripartite-type tricarboxylate transporter receptor subunit TctC